MKYHFHFISVCVCAFTCFLFPRFPGKDMQKYGKAYNLIINHRVKYSNILAILVGVNTG